MHYLLFIGAFLFFLFIAPLKVILATCILLLLITATVKFSTHAIANITPSFGESFKAVGLAFLFVGIAIFTLFSFTKGTGITQFTGIAALGVLAIFFAAYIIGFRSALGTTFGASAVIAIISTVVSGVLISVVKGLL